ncbi:MAG: NAD(P)H-dependent glycerol-3-phosphate dehydrogenase [Alphaproteobacteria bacterium]
MSRGRVHIVGAGAFGSALAKVWLSADVSVQLWCRDPEQAERLNHDGHNPRVPGCLPLAGVRAGTLDRFGAAGEAMAPGDVLILAVKARAQAEVFAALAPHVPQTCQVVTVSKGFATATGDLLSEALSPPGGLAVLSGPSFAADLFAGRPTALTLAANGVQTAMIEQLSTPQLRLYQSDDPIGVQVCGALKNVIAIACGCSDGMGLGASARSALMTRGLREIERVIAVYGGQHRTAAGLAGLGDLALTCQDSQSRNHRFGVQLGLGEQADALLAQGITVEGAQAALALLAGARTAALDLPISQAVGQLIRDNLSPQDLMTQLLARSLKDDVG